MKKLRLEDFTGGWIVGDFIPSIIQTKHTEIGIKYFEMGDIDPKHHHKVAQEITVILQGKFKMNDLTLEVDDMVHLEPGESVSFECLERGKILSVKFPSVKDDKYIDSL